MCCGWGRCSSLEGPSARLQSCDSFMVTLERRMETCTRRFTICFRIQGGKEGTPPYLGSENFYTFFFAGPNSARLGALIVDPWGTTQPPPTLFPRRASTTSAADLLDFGPRRISDENFWGGVGGAFFSPKIQVQVEKKTIARGTLAKFILLL